MDIFGIKSYYDILDQLQTRKKNSEPGRFLWCEKYKKIMENNVMKNGLKKAAKRIISRSNTGKECNYMGVDFLYYGMGIYGYADDVLKSECQYTKGNNDLFLHIIPTEENVEKYLQFVHEQM